ncbi:plastid transcriptionally active 12 [Artemisia annua]|uniref:Plastid transcriptionally active 12 n=1 Tax=Artemisia annua TaxID=35608 RepID=A0A2U1KI62_ARTAN|nr:plastid transcriptionally active 12 [Artemisia annua]
MISGCGCGCFTNKSPLLFQTSITGSFPSSIWQPKIKLNITKKTPLFPCVKCEKKDNDDDSSDTPPERPFEKMSVERAPYHSYRDSISGQVEPASGARASILGQDYLPEGTVGQARAAGAPVPTDTSDGASSYGKNPGSRRKTYKATSAAAESAEVNTEVTAVAEQGVEDEGLDERSEESTDEFSDFVVYEKDTEAEELTGYDLDKKLGRPHPFIDPKVRKPIKEPLTSEELWWNWRKPEKEQWSRWQKKRPDAETVFLKAMAETGQIKLFGEQPTLTETALYRARKHLYKEERLQAEHERLERDGPIAYYSEWVKAWKKDTSREAIQKHYEETGEDENTQLIEMFSCQTAREYRVMMGTDHRISRDPLAMRMKEEQIKQIWGGDPVYPTINYIQEPNQVIDFRGPDFHEPTPDVLAYLKQNGNITSKEEIDKILASEKVEKVKVKTPFSEDDAMAKAVDIGEKEDSDDEGKFDDDENISRNWSVLKTTPELRKTKPKPAKGKGKMTLEEAIADSENLTDFLMDFDQDKSSGS